MSQDKEEVSRRYNLFMFSFQDDDFLLMMSMMFYCVMQRPDAIVATHGDKQTQKSSVRALACD